MVLRVETANIRREHISDSSIKEDNEGGKTKILKHRDNPQQLNLNEVMENASEELADIVSSFGRSGKNNKSKIDDEGDKDYLSCVLDENCEEKFEILIQQISRLHGGKDQIILCARRFFPDYIDLIMILREMLLSRKLSLLQKKKVQEAVYELERFTGTNKLKSAANIGVCAKKFNIEGGIYSLSFKELRDCYLQFLEIDLPPGYIYRYWIEKYGANKRRYLLSFIMNALIADIKSTEPGVQCNEFGPLGTSLLNIRILQTIDQRLVKNFLGLDFFEQIRFNQQVISEEYIVKLYLSGILDLDLRKTVADFSADYLYGLLIRQRAAVMQLLKNSYYLTPDSMYIDQTHRENTLDFMTSVITEIYKKEKNTGIFNEYYK
ncbi:TPA: invasion protein [Escherichia coli]|nr:invasion protein [Escherichia coli]HBA9522827.1 invasion protein [Escherichia coli]HBA9550887.1 invasion protein [Escherichia coli]HBA9560261.1 invasion protein [Escherichia coli]